MSEWIDRFKNNRVHALLAETKQKAVERTDGEAELSVAGQDTLARIKQVLSFVESALGAADPHLVSPGQLDELSKHLDQCRNELHHYSENGSEKHLNAASSHLDALLPYAHIIQHATTAEPGVAAIVEGASGFRSKAVETLKELESATESAEGKLASVEAKCEEAQDHLKAERQRLDAALADHQTQFGEAQNSRGTEFTEGERKRNEAHADLVSEQKTAIEEERKELRDGNEALLNARLERWEEEESKTKEKAEGFLSDLERLKEEARKVVGLIGNTGMSGHYQSVANKEWKSALVWNIVTVLLIGVLITFTIIAYASALESDFSPGAFGARISVAVACGLAAVFTGHIARAHGRTERANRSRELIFASLSPYLETLEPGEAQKIKGSLASVLFTPPPVDEGGKGKPPKDVVGLVQEVFKMAKDLK